MTIRILINKIHAFTLAEILITLSIIGVIAAMVIPSLVQDVQDAQLKSAWKKSFADLNQINIRLVQDNSGSLKGVFTDNNSVKDKYKAYLNYTKDCDENASAGICWHDSGKWKYLNGVAVNNYSPPTLILSNGTFVYFYLSDANCDNPVGTSGLLRCGGIGIDVNGFKGPNTVGKDIYGIRILKNSIKPFGIQDDMSSAISCIQPPDAGWDNADNYGFACSAQFLYK